MRIGFWILIFGFLLSQESITQDLRYPNRPFQPMSVSGEVELGSGYRYQEGTTNNIYNIRESPVLYGGIRLNLDSYILNPGIVLLQLGGEYNPEFMHDNQIVVPDRTETRTLKSIEGSMMLFQDKSINLRAYIRYSDGYTNRENLTNVKMEGNNIGGNLHWSNIIAPISISIDQNDWKNIETETNRTYSSFQKRIQANISKSFSSKDRNELIYFHRDYQRIDALSNETRNISDNINLTNSIYFDGRRRYLLRSMIYGTDQIGSDAFRRLLVNENLTFALPAQLKLTVNYNFSSNKRESQSVTQHNINSILRHQLFQSLTSSLIFGSNRTTQTHYYDRRNKFGLELRYKKKIPFDGHLLISGLYHKQPVKHRSESLFLKIQDEDHILKDGEIEFLNEPNAILSSIIVKDPSGTIIYQEYLDYVLIEQNVYIEIQRVAGGQIPNNSTILVDYSVVQEGSYQYILNYLRIHSSLMLFNRLLEIYYTRSQQDYSNQINTEDVTLNYLTQNIFGLNLEYKFAGLSVTYEDYNSSITPFTLWRYSIRLNGNVKGRLLYTLSGNYRNYHMLYNNTQPQYTDVIGKLEYVINTSARFSIELGYRKQIGEGYDLELFTSRTEFTYNYRKLYLKTGLELYRRTRFDDQLDYYNLYVKLVRTFDWNK